MKINYFLLSLLSVICFACTNEDSEYIKLLEGTWVNTEVNHQAVLTDKKYIMNFRADGVQTYACGFQVDSLNKTWMENDDYEYSLKNGLLTIDGTDVTNKTYHMVFKIITLDESTLIYSVKAFRIDNVDVSDTKIYTCKKVTEDYRSQFEGLWYGRCTSIGTSDLKYHFWEYDSDGLYNYYYQDDQDKWACKSDNEGRYFLYGDLFVSNYNNDLVSGGVGKAYECWTFEITADTMVWSGLRIDNTMVTYRMVRAQNPPVIGQ